jgi:glycerol-3-phosphate acyltransferase PlsY
MLILGASLTAVAAYLLGSMPTGFLVAKARGIDIRTVGSGNIGATNVFRAVGKPAGIFVLLMDALKGWLAVAVLAKMICGSVCPETSLQTQEYLRILAGISAILGHNYTCWLHFKGGKGIATSAGVLVALVLKPFLIILAVWIVVFALSRYVSLGSIAAAITLPFATWLTGQSLTMIGVTSGMSALAIYKHKANIKRLLQGTESRIGNKSKPSANPAKQTP